MVEYYKIFGMRVGSHVVSHPRPRPDRPDSIPPQLSGLTLGTFFGGVWFASRSPSKPAAKNEPPINAKTKEEEAFVKYAQRPRVAPSMLMMV
jgi:hypothetical protein